jgi:hypothetical protein
MSVLSGLRSGDGDSDSAAHNVGSDATDKCIALLTILKRRSTEYSDISCSSVC